MKNIALVTDSTADLTATMKEELNAHVIPLKIVFAHQEYIDGELTAEDFYQKLATAQELPRSSQPSPADFTALYQQLLKQYDQVISIHLSSALSGTVNAARVAADTLQDKIHVVDSKNISLGIGLMVKEAARCIHEGMDTPQILTRITEARKSIETMFTLNTLEYLQKGGRIGKVSGLVGSLLNIKPVVRVNEEGIYVPAGKARSQDKALDQIANKLKEIVGNRSVKSLAIAHGDALDAANKLKTIMETTFGVPATIFTQVSAVIGVHTGPGTVGAAMEFE
ncbi:DegV family protein [Dethiobacter alkaliphilus]|uniref:DegV family protein n=1 Tax=Dethiobacter alkaliphilus TaxID=427926 RepID=UPI002227FCEA|nr:DegV family protein [Dethiobacter alkaliphilus]MCW3490337.1 DegV family protein [Dethiobacter alkaliphilus]